VTECLQERIWIGFCLEGFMQRSSLFGRQIFAIRLAALQAV
jgi:hypothetical protein